MVIIFFFILKHFKKKIFLHCFKRKVALKLSKFWFEMISGCCYLCEVFVTLVGAFLASSTTPAIQYPFVQWFHYDCDITIIVFLPELLIVNSVRLITDPSKINWAYCTLIWFLLKSQLYTHQKYSTWNLYSSHLKHCWIISN